MTGTVVSPAVNTVHNVADSSYGINTLMQSLVYKFMKKSNYLQKSTKETSNAITF